MAYQATKQATGAEVEERIKNNEEVNIIDVREDVEWISGHIPQAKHIPLGQLLQRLDELDKNKEYIMVCAGGNRSSLACEFLSERGYDVTNLIGGMSRWRGEVATGR
ncbi:rhodanese-like domain-containing protein [Ferviditalea candida]|uniref:Rhodanese-like domain-containing protein n=1 Tax=Ferviditalea candida TaxID=3108399 RepID=A0ABU5ZH74_9BACL|nr:rhodanese-like domain-containing protein [Paenibacillaceae bacterium T2]